MTAKMAKQEPQEKVVHPSHYGGDAVYEVIKVCEAWGLDKNAYLFNTVKYVARAGKKEGSTYLEDLKKAAFYLQREINNYENPPDWEDRFAAPQ